MDGNSVPIASWRIALKSGQIIEFKGGWNDIKNEDQEDATVDSLQYGLRQLVDDFEEYIVNGKLPPEKRRYRYKPNDSNAYGNIYIDVKEISSVIYLFE